MDWLRKIRIDAFFVVALISLGWRISKSDGVNHLVAQEIRFAVTREYSNGSDGD